MKSFPSYIALLLLLCTIGCSRGEREIKRWAILLQDIETSKLLELDPDLVVLEPFPNGDSEPGVPKSDLAALQSQGIKILAYLSIGEAENYRAYWLSEWATSPPAFLHSENPDWPGNFKVRYWDPEWQALMEQSLLARVDKGYDGVYFDLVDAYEFYEDEPDVNARQKMIEFIARLSGAAKKRNPAFLVFVQNAEELSADPNYLKAIDGIGREELHYGYEGGDNQATPTETSEEMSRHLNRFKEAGKTVLTIEYTDQPEQIQQVRESSQRSGFLPYFAPRMLNSLPNQGA